MVTALCHQQFNIRCNHVPDQFPGIIIINQRPDGDPDFQVITALSDFFTPHAVMAIFGPEQASIPEIRQRIQSLVDNQVDTAAIAAITAIGATARYIFLAPETQASITAVSCFHLDCCFIYKFHTVIVCGQWFVACGWC